MNNDIKFNCESHIFNYRVGIVIRNNNKILIEKNTNQDYLILPGGKCKLGESSIECAIREFKEETGISIEYVKTLGILENFFYSKYYNKDIHEMLIIHELKFTDDSLYNINILNNIEDKDYIKYEWIEIDKLNESNYKPFITKEFLNTKNIIHKIYKDNI